jgi:drug/metabolite transporter (DMT)-like permease
MRLALGLAVACTASAFYDLAVALQALDARAVPASHSLRLSLLARLAKRPRWVAALALGLLGFPLQIYALTLAPITVVQPALALGLVLLLALGVRMLDESVGSREIVAVAAIFAGIAGIALVAPLRGDNPADAHLAPALAILAVLAAVPFVGRVRRSSLMMLGAGCAFAWAGLSAKLIGDRLSAGDWLAALLLLVATGLIAVIGLLSEMSALQSRPATQVAPTVFVVQVVIPVVVAGAFGGEDWTATPLGGSVLAVLLALVVGGAVALSRSSAVVNVVGAHQIGDRDCTQATSPQLRRQRAKDSGEVRATAEVDLDDLAGA